VVNTQQFRTVFFFFKRRSALFDQTLLAAEPKSFERRELTARPAAPELVPRPLAQPIGWLKTSAPQASEGNSAFGLCEFVSHLWPLGKFPAVHIPWTPGGYLQWRNALKAFTPKKIWRNPPPGSLLDELVSSRPKNLETQGKNFPQRFPTRPRDHRCHCGLRFLEHSICRSRPQDSRGTKIDRRTGAKPGQKNDSGLRTSTRYGSHPCMVCAGKKALLDKALAPAS